MTEGYKTLVVCMCSASAVVFTAYTWHQPLVTSALLLVLGIGILIVEHTDTALYAYLFGSIVGPLAEMVCIGTGAWSYDQAPVFGMVPYWLPLLWGIASLLLYRWSYWCVHRTTYTEV